MKLIGKILLILFLCYSIIQNLANTIGAMIGFGIDLDGSLRMWMVFCGGLIPSTVTFYFLSEKLEINKR